jgi:predicted DNA-binding ribbon-helix-helix protein
MRSPVVKRSIVIAGHKTSVSLEDAFWKSLKEIALAQRMTLSDLVAAVDSQRRHGNLSSAIRLYVLQHFQTQTNGHGGNGNGGDERHFAVQDTQGLMAAATKSSSVMRPE